MRSRTWSIPVKEWFPPNDALAAIMARLCVLREDLYLELEGLKDQKFDRLEQRGDPYKAIYYFRNSAKTLFEIRKAILKLKGQKVFMQQLANQKDFHAAFKEFDKVMSKSEELVKRLRHETSGHLDPEAFNNALERMPSDTKGLFQGGTAPKTVHYKFSIEFLGAIFLSKVEKVAEKEEWERILDTTCEAAFKAINTIDLLFMAYVQQRGFEY